MGATVCLGTTGFFGATGAFGVTGVLGAIVCLGTTGFFGVIKVSALLLGVFGKTGFVLGVVGVLV